MRSAYKYMRLVYSYMRSAYSYMRSMYLYILGFIVFLVAAKAVLFWFEGVNLGEIVSLIILLHLLILAWRFSSGHPRLFYWGGGVALVSVLLAEGYERFYHFLTGKWLAGGYSIIFFWIVALIVDRIAIWRMKKQK